MRGQRRGRPAAGQGEPGDGSPAAGWRESPAGGAREPPGGGGSPVAACAVPRPGAERPPPAELGGGDGGLPRGQESSPS